MNTVPAEDNWIVLALQKNKHLPLHRTQEITRAVRKALIAFSPQPVPSIISGHQYGDSYTAPLESTHTSIIALPNLSHPHSDGKIAAIAIALPSETTPEEKTQIEWDC